MIHMKEGDHIPWAYTRGIYGDLPFQPYKGKVLLVAFNDGFTRRLPEDLNALCEKLKSLDDFKAIAIDDASVMGSKLAPYKKQYPNSRAFIFSRNGTLTWVFFNGENVADREEEVVGVVKTPKELRHVGNAWHYPDWRDYPSIENRPLNWGHLYMADQFNEDEPPSISVLVQGVLDVIHASMYHMEDDDDREELVSSILTSVQMLYDREEHLRYWDD